MPQNPNIVCAKMSESHMLVFDCTKPQQVDPDLILTCSLHDVFGIGKLSGLAWHPIKEGYLLFSNGHIICAWDMSAVVQCTIVCDPIHVYDYHEVI